MIKLIKIREKGRKILALLGLQGVAQDLSSETTLHTLDCVKTTATNNHVRKGCIQV